MIVLFVEDRPMSIIKQQSTCHEMDLEVEMISTAIELDAFLEKKHSEVCLIVMDIMLHGVPHLEDIDIDNSYTDGGYEAGWVIIERYLRPLIDTIAGEVLPEQGRYAKIPIVILSTRPLSEEVNKERLIPLNEPHRSAGVPLIQYIEKDGSDQNGIDCDEAFKKTLEISVEYSENF